MSEWSGITVNDAGEVIEIAVDFNTHTMADWKKLPSALKHLDVSNTYGSVTDESLKLFGAQCEVFKK